MKGLVGQEDIQGEGKTWTSRIEDQGADWKKLHANGHQLCPIPTPHWPLTWGTACCRSCFSAQEECGDLDALRGTAPMTRESRQERLSPGAICGTVTYMSLQGEKGDTRSRQGWAPQSCLWKAPTAHARATPPTAAPAHGQLPGPGSSQCTKSCVGLQSLRLMSAPSSWGPSLVERRLMHKRTNKTMMPVITVTVMAMRGRNHRPGLGTQWVSHCFSNSAWLGDLLCRNRL